MSAPKTPREEAERRLDGLNQGSDWAKADAIKGVGWALLVLADTIAEAAEKISKSRTLAARRG